MKKFFTLVALCACFAGTAQDLKKEVQTDKYMRNSLCLMMMEDASVPNLETLRQAFLNAAWNNKYNNHNINSRVIDPSKITITKETEAAFDLACTPTDQYFEILDSKAAAPKQTYYNENFNQIFRSLMEGQTKTIDTVIKLNVARTATQYLIDNNVAKELANKWFLDAEGHYSDAPVIERGLLNVSADQQELANQSAAERQKLLREIDYDELLGNTFVVVSRFGYKPKDDLIADIMFPMYVGAEFDPSGYGKMGLKGVEMGMKMSMGKGYYVTVDSYLFRLRWNDRILDSFYSMWDDNGNFDYNKYKASDLFALEFVGNERAWAKTKAGIFANKTEDELIRLAAVDAVDGVLSKFEKKYDQFKTKTPLIVKTATNKKGVEEPVYSVKLGTRDGLDGGEVFEVLEKKIVMKDSIEKVTYVKKGELVVNKKSIWDNTYSDELVAEEKGDAAKKGEAVTETLLEGKDKQSYYEGMLLRMKSKKK